MTADSMFITASFVAYLCSSSGSNFIILLIDGVIGYSSFAAMIVTVGRSVINYTCLFCSVRVVCATDKYLSKMFTAKK
jgi:hypothetical protein